MRAFLRWTPDGLPAIFPVRWDGVLVVLRLPRGGDVYVRDAVRPRHAKARQGDGGSGAGDDSRVHSVSVPLDPSLECLTAASQMNVEVGVRVELFEDAMSSHMVALIETLGVAGLVQVHKNDFDGGAVLDIPADSLVEAERLRRNLDVWRVVASILPTKGR